MYKVVIEKKVYLPKNRNTININCSFGTHSSPEQDKVDRISEMYVTQLVTSLRLAISSFDKSDISNCFIKDQSFCISNDNYLYDHRGCYNSDTDIIYFDADSINGTRRINPAHLLGHELGHKIMKYRDVSEVFDELSVLLHLPRECEDLFNEIYADICGNIVANTHDLQCLDCDIIGDEFNSYLNNMVLKSIHKC